MEKIPYARHLRVSGPSVHGETAPQNQNGQTKCVLSSCRMLNANYFTHAFIVEHFHAEFELWYARRNNEFRPYTGLRIERNLTAFREL